MTHSVTIRFYDHHVRVHADDKSVIDRVARSFRNMLAPNPSEHKDQDDTNVLEIRHGEQSHALWRDGSPIFNDQELRRVQRALRHEIISCFVRARPNLLWLHAGAAVHGGKAVLFIGQYGRGKSTLVTQLCARGWRYASDDIVPLDVSAARVFPFPLTPIVRQAVGTELPRERLTDLRKLRVSLPRSALHTEPVPVGGIVFPKYRAGTGAKLEPHSPAAAALEIMRHGINREEHGSATVAVCARLVTEVPVLSVAFSNATDATDLVVRRLNYSTTSIDRRNSGNMPSRRTRVRNLAVMSGLAERQQLADDKTPISRPTHEISP